MKEKLALRKKIKSKKPSFLREDWHKKKRVSASSWRRPKGRHSKMRHGFQGHPANATPGYGSPKDVKGLHKSGLLPVNTSNMKELEVLDKAKHAVVINAGVGKRKKTDIVKKASELGLKIINIKDPAAYIKKVEEELSKKNAAKAEQKKNKKEKVEEKEKKEEEKKEAPVTAEEKKKKETKEFEKVLTKRGR